MSIELVCFGELLWDIFPDKKVAGGAPFNIVNRAQSLGLEAAVISAVGTDSLGEELISLVRSRGNRTEYIQRHEHLSTGRVLIEVGPSGEPQYDIVFPVAWDDVSIQPALTDLARKARAFIYSSLGLRDERSRNTLFEILPLAPFRICDVNLREGHYTKSTVMRMLKYAHVLKMNLYELQIISEWMDHQLTGVEEQVAYLSRRYDCDAVVVTLGERGALSYAQGRYVKQPVFEVDVVDTVGSGDAFLAGYLYKKLLGEPEESCLRFACAVGALTASKRGGTPELQAREIEELINSV